MNEVEIIKNRIQGYIDALTDHPERKADILFVLKQLLQPPTPSIPKPRKPYKKRNKARVKTAKEWLETP
jgi:hypothetical protein